MSSPWRAATVLAGLLQAAIVAGDARAFTPALLAGAEDKTVAFTRPGGPKMLPYGARLHHEIITEIRRNDVPFRLIAPARVIVVFAVNRRGELVHLSVARKTRSKLIDDYAMTMVRQASRRFPAAPANEPGEPLAYAAPITLN